MNTKSIFALAVIVVFIVSFSASSITGSATAYVYRNGTYISVQAPTASPPEYDHATQAPYWNGEAWSLIPAPPGGLVWAGAGWGIGNLAPNSIIMYFDGAPEGKAYVWNGNEYILESQQAVNNAPSPDQVYIWDETLGQWVLGPPQPEQVSNCAAEGGWPDLIVEQITSSPSPPGPGLATIEIIVKNQGLAQAGPSKTRLKTDELNGLYDLDTPAIDCGATVTVTKTYDFADEQPHGFTAWADSNNDVAETNNFGDELNNGPKDATLTAVAPDFYSDRNSFVIANVPAFPPALPQWSVEFSVSNIGTADTHLLQGMAVPIADVILVEHEPDAKATPFMSTLWSTIDLSENIPVGGAVAVSKTGQQLPLNFGKNSFFAVSLNPQNAIREFNTFNNMMVVPYREPDFTIADFQLDSVQLIGSNYTAVSSAKLLVGEKGIFKDCVDITFSAGDGSNPKTTQKCVPANHTWMPGDVVPLSFTHNYLAGNYVARATVDGQNKVIELNDNNNDAILNVNI